MEMFIQLYPFYYRIDFRFSKEQMLSAAMQQFFCNNKSLMV